MFGKEVWLILFTSLYAEWLKFLSIIS